MDLAAQCAASTIAEQCIRRARHTSLDETRVRREAAAPRSDLQDDDSVLAPFSGAASKLKCNTDQRKAGKWKTREVQTAAARGPHDGGEHEAAGAERKGDGTCAGPQSIDDHAWVGAQHTGRATSSRVLATSLRCACCSSVRAVWCCWRRSTMPRPMELKPPFTISSPEPSGPTPRCCGACANGDSQVGLQPRRLVNHRRHRTSQEALSFGRHRPPVSRYASITRPASTVEPSTHRRYGAVTMLRADQRATLITTQQGVLMKIDESIFSTSPSLAPPEPRRPSDQRNRQPEKSTFASPHGLEPLKSALAHQQNADELLAPRSAIKQTTNIEVKSALGPKSEKDVKNDKNTADNETIPSFGGGFCGRASHGDEAASSHEFPIFNLAHVPYVAQGDDRNGCWYACAQMIGYNVELGPRLGVPALHDAASGHNRLDLGHASDFMGNEQLSTVDLPDSRQFSHEDLGALLYRHGPIIFGWQTPGGNWHMSVLTGVDRETDRVVFHDPERGPGKTMPLSYFNERLAWNAPHAMLYRHS